MTIRELIDRLQQIVREDSISDETPVVVCDHQREQDTYSTFSVNAASLSLAGGVIESCDSDGNDGLQIVTLDLHVPPEPPPNDR